jgi:prepilin-type N-terminal cleavage/methylation domain-containing protein
MRVKTNNKGFTLVELIVVITIIAILATVAVIGYNKFIDRANQTKAATELAQIGNALRAEAVNNPNCVYNDGENELTVTLEANTLKFEFSVEDEEAMAELLKKLLESIELDDFVGSLEIRKDESESKYNLVYKDKYSGAEATLENLEITVAILD